MSGMQGLKQQQQTQQQPATQTPQPQQFNQPAYGSGKGGGQPANSPYQSYQSIYNAPLAQSQPTQQYSPTAYAQPAIQTMVPQNFAPAPAPIVAAAPAPLTAPINYGTNSRYGEGE